MTPDDQAEEQFLAHLRALLLGPEDCADAPVFALYGSPEYGIVYHYGTHREQLDSTLMVLVRTNLLQQIPDVSPPRTREEMMAE